MFTKEIALGNKADVRHGSYSLFLACRPHGGKQQDVPDGAVAREQHDQAIQTDTYTTSWRHTVLHRLQKILIQGLGFLISGLVQCRLSLESFALLEGIVQLAEGVGKFVPGYEQFKTIHKGAVTSA